MIQLGHLVNVWKPNRINRNNRNYSKFEGKWQNASGKASTQERNGKRQQKQTKRNPLDPKWMNSSNLISLLIFLLSSPASTSIKNYHPTKRHGDSVPQQEVNIPRPDDPETPWHTTHLRQRKWNRHAPTHRLTGLYWTSSSLQRNLLLAI